MWLVGASIAACGTAVYVELGTVSLHHFPSFFVFICKQSGFTPQWRREKLFRIYLSQAQIPRYVHFCFLYAHNGTQAEQLSAEQAIYHFTHLRAQLQQIVSFSVNVCAFLSGETRKLTFIRSSPCFLCRAYMVKYALGCIFMPHIYMLNSWYPAAMGTSCAECSWSFQTHHSCPYIILRSTLFGGL